MAILEIETRLKAPLSFRSVQVWPASVDTTIATKPGPSQDRLAATARGGDQLLERRQSDGAQHGISRVFPGLQGNQESRSSQGRATVARPSGHFTDQWANGTGPSTDRARSG